MPLYKHFPETTGIENAPVEIVSVAAGVSIPTGKELVDNDGTYIYEGFAPFGTATSAASWTIIRTTIDGSGFSDVLLADGNLSADNVWDDRATTVIYS